MAKKMKTYGPWAVVTGASSGIGAGFAEELADAGLNVVLVARNREAMGKLAATLTAKGVETRIIVQDLTASDATSSVFDAIGDLDVGLLVSNAGVAKMGGFLQNRVEDLGAMLRLNVIAHMELCHWFASRLLRRGRTGGILLVSSTAALQPVPLAANYSGAKSFVLNFGESLNAELRSMGIDVTVLLPGPTDTRAINARDDIDMSTLPMPTMSVRSVVRQGFTALRRGRSSHIAGWVNRWMARMTPRRISGWVFGKLLHKRARKHLLPDAPLAEATHTPRAAEKAIEQVA